MPSKQVEDAYNARHGERSHQGGRPRLGVPKTSRNWNHNKFLESLYGKRVCVSVPGNDDPHYLGDLICHDSFTVLIRVESGREILIFKGAGVSINEFSE